MKFNLRQGITAVGALAKLGHVAVSAAGQVLSAMPDGITEDEAERIAVATFEREDIKVLVNGVDIVDSEAQAHLLAGVGRICRRLYVAVAGA